MITSEGQTEKDKLTQRGDGYSNLIVKNGNGGEFVRKNQMTNFISTETSTTYNVGFGSTTPTAAWVEWTAAQCDRAGVSTVGMDPTKPDSTQVVQINVPQSNIYTVGLYGDTVRLAGQSGKQRSSFFDLYESQDDRHARHKELRAKGLTPPFPRADKFYQNKHQGYVRPGVTTEGSY